MPERLTAAFVVAALLLLAGAGLVRSVILDEAIAARESGHLQQQVRLIGALLEARRDAGQGSDQELLQSLVPADAQLLLAGPGRPVLATGESYDGPSDDDLSASTQVADASLTLRQDDAVVPRLLTQHPASALVLALLVAVLAGVLGYLIARALSAPFRQLAGAARALGRGRFELDLPRTGIPEARAIAQALQTSARELEQRLQREQSFAEHASHHLRTPLTGLRLELEDLALREGLPADAREVAERGLVRVGQVDTVAGELVELSRAGALVQGAQIPLRDLATQCAQRWADELAQRDRVVTAGVEGALDTTYTPGPIEHVLDLVLADVLRRTRGAVRLAFDADPGGHLRVRVTATPREGAEPALDRARSVAEVLGGRLRSENGTGDLELLLPRR